MLRNRDHQGGFMRGASNKFHVGIDTCACPVERQAQWNHIMNGDDRGRARKVRWSKIWNMNHIHPSLTCGGRACILFPYQLFHIVVAGNQSWNGLPLKRKPGQPNSALRERMCSQQDIFVLLVNLSQRLQQVRKILTAAARGKLKEKTVDSYFHQAETSL